QTLHHGLSFARYSEVSHSTTGTLSLSTAFTNSLTVVLVSTIVVLLLALPAAYALAIHPVKKWRDVLFFFISTKFLPIVASIFPIAAPGIAATALLCVIFAWNEYFYAIQLNFASGSTMPQWVIGNVSTRGNFLAKLSAASMIACLPVILAGWAAQKRMIRGLSMGAIK